MQLPEIMALPVRELLKRDAIVYLWATGAMLLHALASMEAWGLTYKSSFVWRKVTRNGKVRLGTGRWAQSGHELVLLGTVGKPRCFSCRRSLTVSRASTAANQTNFTKPSPRRPRPEAADLFAREKREGWECFGDEVEKFPAAGTGAEHGGIHW